MENVGELLPETRRRGRVGCRRCPVESNVGDSFELSRSRRTSYRRLNSRIGFRLTWESSSRSAGISKPRAIFRVRKHWIVLEVSVDLRISHVAARNTADELVPN